MGKMEKTNLGLPAVQIWFPNLVYRILVNPHRDNYVYDRNSREIERVIGEACDPESARSFLIPLSTPPGGGLLWFAAPADRPGSRKYKGTHAVAPWIEESKVAYHIGSLYTFTSLVAHA